LKSSEEIMKTPEDICPDFPEWPNRWHGLAKDIPYGKGILEAMRPFVEHLSIKGLNVKTIRRHMDNLWLLGGEVIRDVSTFDQYNVPPAEMLRRSVSSEGGPYCRHLDSEYAMNAYDATCRKLHKFLEGEK